MSEDDPAATFPPPEFVRRGPPVSVEHLDRSDQEKWARVVAVVPEETDDGDSAFVTKGPYTLPMAVRREDVDRGSRHAWTFFTHPYSVFPEEATYYNVAGKGCLGARIYHRTAEGVVLYDEVGAGIPDAEMVADSFAGAMGVLRRRALGAGGDPTDRAYTTALLEFDLDLLEVFRLTTLLLQAHSPQKVLQDLAGVLERPTIREFAHEALAEEDLEGIRAAEGGEAVVGFAVREEDFTKVTDVRDAKNRPAIQELLSEWEAFEQEHGARLAELGRGIQEAEENIARIKREVKELQSRDAERGRISRFFSKDTQTLKQLKAEAVQNLRTMRELESAYHEIPGYDRLHGLSERVQEFQEAIRSIYRLARDLFDGNVTQAQLKAMRSIVRDRIAGDPAAAKPGLKAYDLRLRAEVLPRLLTTYSVSAYVLRRPDALPPSPSLGSVQRVNRMARNLIEYFRHARYGSKTLGEAFDETWGQVLNIEGRL